MEETIAALTTSIEKARDNPVIPREWVLVPLFVLNDAVEKIKGARITGYIYDPNSTRLVKRATPPALGGLA